jgi:UDP-glucuronate decarboxylase
MRCDDGRIVSNLICQALRAEPLTIYGTGEQTRSFCYVSDLVGGLIALMEAPGPVPGPINLGNPDEFTINELATLVVEMTGSASEVVHLPLPVDDPRRRRPDIAKAERLLDWRPQVGLRDGLPESISWFESALAAERPALRRRKNAPAAATA